MNEQDVRNRCAINKIRGAYMVPDSVKENAIRRIEDGESPDPIVQEVQEYSLMKQCEAFEFIVS